MDSKIADSSDRHRVVFTTERGRRHQRLAIEAAPGNLQITMLRGLSGEALAGHLADARFLISERSGVIDADLIRSAPLLELIVRIGSLTFDIDLEAAMAAEVIVCTRPIDSVIRVAEHAIMQMLALGTRLRKAETIAMEAGDWGESRRTSEDTFAFNWSGMSGTTGVWQQSVGIIGFGEIGTEIARRLHGWGCSLMYNKRHRLPESVESDLALRYVNMETLFRESDYVVNLLPYSVETDNMIGSGVISTMKSGSFFLSYGSGAIVNEAALAEAIESGQLGGVALDTFEWEPIRRNNPLVALMKAGFNVVLTPHFAGGDKRAALEERRGYYTPISDHLAGRPIQFQVG